VSRGLCVPREPRLALPAWTDVGLLPLGIQDRAKRHTRARYVLDTPNRQRRELLFEALGPGL